MGQMLVYSVVSGLVLAVMYLVYKIALASEKQYAYNRAVILTIYAVALIAPVVAGHLPELPDWRVPVSGGSTVGSIIAPATEGVADPDAPMATDPAPSGPSVIPLILGWIYLAGMVVAGIFTLLTVWRLAALIRGGERYDFDRFTVIVYDSPGVAPFSWQRYVIMSRADFEDTDETILTHELCHIESLHWIDLLMAQLVIIFQWYNPAAWLMREELMLVHEYQADEAVIRSGANLRQYQMLLIKKAVGGRFQSLANSLNHSNLKKRITMMCKSRSSAGCRLRALALVPAALVAVAVLATPGIASALESVSHTPDSGIADENEVVTAMTDDVTATDTVYPAAETSPRYPGGEAAVLKFLSDKMQYPEKAIKDNVSGRVIVQFIVNAEGNVTSPRVIRSVSPEIDAEARRVVSLLDKFIPGTMGGKPVSTYYTVPITFSLKKGANREGD